MTLAFFTTIEKCMAVCSSHGKESHVLGHISRDFEYIVDFVQAWLMDNILYHYLQRTHQ